MADELMRGYRVQLTTTMDSVLRTALFEVMKIFENALHEQKVQLAQKAAEISQLKVKLRRAELKLKDLPSDCPKQAETQTQVFSDASALAPAVAQGDFKGSYEHCAPLGCETGTQKEEGLYPNVKLRPFSIQLSQIPVKAEASNYSIHLKRKGHSKTSGKFSGANAELEHGLIRTKLNCDQQNQRQQKPIKKDMYKLLEENRRQHSDILDLARLRTRNKSETTLPKKNPSDQSNSADKDSKSTGPNVVENNPTFFSCMYCNKNFTTKGGLKTHIRYHKTCQGCRNVFPYVEFTNVHKKSCKNYRKLMKNEAKNSTNTHEEDNVPALSRSQVTIKEEPMETSVNPTNALPVRHLCHICNIKFKLKAKFDKHMRHHTLNTWPCSMCSRLFFSLGTLKCHMTRVHKDPSHFFDANGDLGWTMPLEDFEDC
ncbi:zinc finger protein 425 isoform X1 [Nothobranchius furzeri]|uniref:Transcript variant X1 n=1 Tax=Nothobranchius furzeri TaxID=105023 RepID=A0A9D3C2Z9_NOTFU|nr:transcript variant X1 [Nothobranchius furzeri]KAF7228219.1 transcript variant X2 [Nothobranchius furzeri]